MVLSPNDPDSRSAGSFFKNPIVPLSLYEKIAAGFAPAPVPRYPAPDGWQGEPRVKIPAAWLLEKAGFHRGYVRGQAGISSRHTLALINRGGARAVDILALRDEIRAGVERQFSVRLEPEPVWLG
jgi:UDP-N-acetylmuramate dehydrogenase